MSTPAFQDLDEFLDDCLPLPNKGKVYRVPDVDYDTGVWLTTQIDRGLAVARKQAPAESAELDDEEERNLWSICLGPVLEELQADGVGWFKIRHFGGTALMWHTKGLKLAQKYWHEAANLDATEDGDDDAPEGEARGNRASRRASSAGANNAPSPASTSTTTDGKKSPQDHLPPRGRNSSSTGA